MTAVGQEMQGSDAPISSGSKIVAGVLAALPCRPRAVWDRHHSRRGSYRPFPMSRPEVSDRGSDNLDCSSCCGDLLQLAFCEKADPAAVGRPERVLGIFGSWQSAARSHHRRPPPQQRALALGSGGKHDRASIRRQGELRHVERDSWESSKTRSSRADRSRSSPLRQQPGRDQTTGRETARLRASRAPSRRPSARSDWASERAEQAKSSRARYR